MVIRIPCLLILFTYGIANISADAKNETVENKSKRGIFHFSDPNYPIVPLHQLARYPQLRALSEDSSQIDITYKPYEDIKSHAEHSVYPQQSYDFSDALKISSNNNFKINEPTPLSSQTSYSSNQYSNPIAQQSARTNDHVAVPSQHLAAPHFQSFINQKPLQFYGNEKQVALPTSIKPAHEIKFADYLDSYNPIPIIYGQPNGALPSLKYIQPLTKSPYNLQTAYGSLPLQNAYYKLPAKIQVSPLQQQRSLTQGFKPSPYFQPQTFDNPIVPQLQHYIPQVQSPFDAFTKSAPLAAAKPTNPPPKKEQKQESDEEEDDDDEDEKEEIDEDEFERGYEDASRGFPRNYDDEEDYKRSRYRNDDDDDDHHERYKGRYESDYDDHKGHYSTKEYSRKPHDHDDRKGRHGDRDHEEYHSSKNSKKEPKKHYKKSSYESSKYYKSEDSDRAPSKKPVSYSKHYKSTSKKPQTDSRYVSSSPKKQSIKKSSNNQKESASTKSEVEFKPNYEYGFEPLKLTQENSKVRELDSVAKSSEPSHSRKLFKSNWYYTKSTKTK